MWQLVLADMVNRQLLGQWQPWANHSRADSGQQTMACNMQVLYVWRLHQDVEMHQGAPKLTLRASSCFPVLSRPTALKAFSVWLSECFCRAAVASFNASCVQTVRVASACSFQGAEVVSQAEQRDIHMPVGPLSGAACSSHLHKQDCQQHTYTWDLFSQTYLVVSAVKGIVHSPQLSLCCI